MNTRIDLTFVSTDELVEELHKRGVRVESQLQKRSEDFFNRVVLFSPSSITLSLINNLNNQRVTEACEGCSEYMKVAFVRGEKGAVEIRLRERKFDLESENWHYELDVKDKAYGETRTYQTSHIDKNELYDSVLSFFNDWTNGDLDYQTSEGKEDDD